MAGMRIQIKNIDKVENFIIELPKKIQNELHVTNKSFMKRVEKSAKLKAPVDTGSLRDSIKLLPVKRGKKVSKYKLVVDAPYALFQEEGYTPHAFYAGGALNSSKLTPGQSYFVSRWTPFIKPAIAEQIAKYNDKISAALNRALK